jgi:NAD(P)-dependent dehydrogenase (short-subunit alcohol dehydrogenase family)
MGRLEGDVAFITASGGAIAGATAVRFASEGAAVACVDIDGPAAEATARRIRSAGGRAIAIPCDVADEAAVKDAVARAIGEFGKLTLVMNAAAVSEQNGDVVELPTADWQRSIAVNLTSYFLVCKYTVPHLRRAGGGSIINIASQLGSVVVRARPAYVTTKAAIIQLSKSMAVDFAKDNIRVNSLSPGAIETNRLLYRWKTMEAARAAMAPLHPIGRLGQPEEIADAALFLASRESRFMTGSDLVVDGAYTAV